MENKKDVIEETVTENQPNVAKQTENEAKAENEKLVVEEEAIKEGATDILETPKKKSFLQSNEMARLVVVLLAITFVTALLLAGVNEITAPIIKARENGAVMEIMQAHFPAVVETEAFDVSGVASSVKEHTRALDSTGNHIGDVVIVGPTGYGGEIQIVVVIDINGSVKTTEVLSDAETSGIGTKAYDPSFTSQFEGKVTTEGIDTIAGATVTSTAYIKGVTDALDYIQSLSVGGAR